MIKFLDTLSFLINVSYVAVFMGMMHTFLPLRKSWPVRGVAFFACTYLANVIVYSNDIFNLLGALLGMAAYIFVFHCGHWTRKLTALFVFYPALIAVNYLMQDVGSRVFFSVTDAPGGFSMGWTHEQLLISTVIHALTVIGRLLFWLFSWQFLRRYLNRITADLTIKMWLLVDLLMLSPFVAIFTIIYFMPENPLIVYPICGTSIFSSFGCLYLAAYICTSVRTEFRAQELEQKQAYYRDKINEEERVRRIYHDLKNHLLVLQQTENSPAVQTSIQELQSRVQAYENYQHTGNEYLDIIIRDKARAAQEKKITLSVSVSFEAGSFLQPLDISTIFGNVLDNAIEACEQLQEDSRLVIVKANRVHDMLVIVVENTMPPVPVSDARTTKKDKFAHGFGLTNIRDAVQKYGGQCNTRSEDGIFSLKIVIPIPKNAANQNEKNETVRRKVS